MSVTTAAGELATAALDVQVNPALILSDDKSVSFANRAAVRLFGIAQHDAPTTRPACLIPGSPVTDLPIQLHGHNIQQGLNRSFATVLAECLDELEIAANNNADRHDLDYDDFWSDQECKNDLWLQVVVLSEPARPVHACLSFQYLQIDDGHAFLLTLSKPRSPITREVSFVVEEKPQPAPQLNSSILRAHFSKESSPIIERAPSVSSLSQPQLEARFAQLRDAIYYHNGEFAGFLLSADEKFAFPNYRGGKHVQPVEIDDLDQFFLSGWNLWDEHFTRRLGIEEFPSIILSRGRENFKNRRYGLIGEDGTRTSLECSGECLYDQYTEEFLGSVVWVQWLGDYSEVLLRDQEGRLGSFEAICDSMPHIVYTSKGEGIDYLSKGWYEYTGCSSTTSIGDQYQNSVHPDDMPVLMKAFVKHRSDGLKHAFISEARYRRHDGVYRWMSVRQQPVRDDKGVILKWYGTLTEIDEVVKLRMEANEVNKHMMNVLAHADVSLFRVNTSWDVSMLRGKPLMAHGTDHTKGLIDGQNVYQGLSNLQAGGVPDFESKLRETMNGYVTSMTSEDQVNGRRFRTRMVPDVVNSGVTQIMRGVIGCSIDITDLHERANLELENARLVADEQLARESSRLKSQFLAHMSHEIRTPIAGVIGMADILAGTNLSKDQRDNLDSISISAQNLLIIVNDILDFSKVEAGAMQLETISFNLAALIRETSKLHMHAVHQRSLTFSYSGNIPDDLELIGDPGRIRQILTNLLTNAIKFTTDGSIRLSVKLSDKEARISVEDSGVGMGEETCAQLFVPFRQGDSSTARLYGGTGLGLTISQNLAEMMGGKLDVSSELNVGTKVTFTLPLIRASRPRVAPRQSTIVIRDDHGSDMVKNSHSKILIVEDNPINQKIALTSVRKLGYQATAVGNGQEALEYLLEPHKVDLILMDVQMPIMDGYSATRNIRTQKSYEHLKNIPIIALTASAIKGDNDRCREAGMNDYLSKPYPLKTLKEKLAFWSSTGT